MTALQSLETPTTFGRDAQLAQLSQLVDQVLDGRGASVLVTGEAGIGKTRVVGEARALASRRGMHVLEGSAFELDHALPYGPITDLFRAFFTSTAPQQALDELGPAVLPLARLLPVVTAWLPRNADSLPASGLDEKQQTQQALLLAFDRLIQRGPTLLVIEDVHWADEASLDLLLHLARLAMARPLLLIVTLRTEDAGPSVIDWRLTLQRQRLIRELPLQPLGRSDLEAMVESILGGAPRSDMLEVIVGLTEGNPFFVEEVLRSGLFFSEAHLEPGAMRIPRSVHDAVQRRVDRLGESARRAVQIAAVAGRRFDFALLQAVLGKDEHELITILKELIAAQLVVEDADERFAFRHALTRQAVYADLLGRERRALHAEVLAVLEHSADSGETVPPEELSYHAHAAGAWITAATCAGVAGHRSLSMHAPRAAIEHFGRALDAAAKLGQTPNKEVLRGRGQAHHDLGQFELARADYEAALCSATLAGDKRLAWQLLTDLNLLWSARDYAVAGEYAQNSLEAARELNDKACIARSLNRVGNWCMNIGRMREALGYQEQALEQLEALGDRRGVADTLNVLGMTSAFIDPEQSAAYYDRALPLQRELDDRQGLVIDLVMRTIDGGFYYGDTFAPAPLDPAQSAKDVHEALALAHSIDWRAGEAFAMFELALAYGIRGCYRRAFEFALSGLQAAEEIDHRQWIAASLCSLGALHVDVLAADRGQPLLERALALAHQLGSSVWASYAAARLAMAHTLARDFSKADAVLDAELDAHRPFESATQRQLWCARAELLLARGAATEALDISEKLAATLAPGKVAPRVWILRGQALTALRSAEETERMFLEAIDASRTFGLRSQLWRAHAGRARFLRARGRRDEAAGEVQAARMLVQEVAVEITDNAERSTFVQRAFEHIPEKGLASERRLSKQAFGGLTAREREVAALIGAGLSNRAISERLVVSERTVESYVSSTLAKLGFSARTQIAAWAATRRVAPHSE